LRVAFPDQHWYRLSWLSIALLPFAGVFRLIAIARRAGFRLGWIRSTRLPVPVIVVGNITAGGTGKTPLVIWLYGWLREHGYRPGVVSRGYRGRGQIRPVFADTDPSEVGDEPVLLAQRCGGPVWVGRDRAAAAQSLLLAHPECDVILSDDGLQHYRLQRNVEIAVVDGQRGVGNRLPIPAGPLRESTTRLAQVDAVVINGEGPFASAKSALFRMQLHGSNFQNLLNPEFQAGAADFNGKRVHAVAGIGNPLRFFAHLQQLGLSFSAHPFPDHHKFIPADLEFGDADAVIMTEKDAIKCRRFARERYWMLAVDAHIGPELGQLILNKLKSRHGS
jgi:tetraacyldisaccharide 4'-kinase